MGKYMRTLKTLREIALEHATVERPDLASMARELGRVVHQNSPTLSARLPVGWRWRERRPDHWLLAERGRPAISVLLMAWPPNHLAPLHDATRWGLDMTLLGAIEVQAYARDPQSGNLRLHGRDWLGPGDASWFDGGEQHARRCRNLSGRNTAFTLHVYAGDLKARRAGAGLADASGAGRLPRGGVLA